MAKTFTPLERLWGLNCWRNRFHNDLIGIHPFLGQVLRKKETAPVFYSATRDEKYFDN